MNIFLPKGYPASVSDDYKEYQVWDTIQAFCSAITAALATYGVLQSVNDDPYIEYNYGCLPCSFFRSRYRPHRSKGPSLRMWFIPVNATVLAATMTWFIKDGLGYLGRVLFVWKQGKLLYSDCKQWRLYSEIINSMARCVEIIAPVFPNYFILFVSLASVCKSIVCVASGATRAALTHHQARRNNFAEVSAKDLSQETILNLAAMLVYLLLIFFAKRHPLFVFALFILFTIFHLYANYRAVNCIIMPTLNKARLHFIIKEYLRTGRVFDIKTVNRKTSVIWRANHILTFYLGCSANRAIKNTDELEKMERIYTSSGYFVNFDQEAKTVYAVFEKGAKTDHYLRAAIQFELLDFIIAAGEKTLDGPSGTCSHMRHLMAAARDKDTFALLTHSHAWVDTHYTGLREELKNAGWKLDGLSFYVDEWRIQWPY